MFKWNKLLLLVELWWAQINYLNEPLWTFRIRKNRNREKIHFLIDNRKILYEHGGLHPMIARKVKYTPRKVYNIMKETFIKNWKSKSALGFNSSEKFQISLIMIYQRAIWDVQFVSNNCGMTCRKKLSYWKN